MAEISPGELGDMQGQIKWEKGKTGTEKNKKCCSGLQREMWKDPTLLLVGIYVWWFFVVGFGLVWFLFACPETLIALVVL